MNDAMVLLLSLLLGLYAWLSTAESSIALLRLAPRLDTGAVAKRAVFTPRWEVTNALLVVGVFGFTVVFNDALVSIMQAMLPVIIIGTTALVARVAAAFYLARAKVGSGDATFASKALVLSNSTVLLSLATVGVYLLLGHAFWQTASGWIFMLSAAALLLALSLSFMYWRAGSKASQRLQWASRVSIALFTAFGAIIGQLVVRANSPHLLTVPFALFVLIISCTLLWQGALFTTKRADHGMWWCMSLIVVITPVLLALANRPWLVYGQYLINH